jgi:hypothetical protein
MRTDGWLCAVLLVTAALPFPAHPSRRSVPCDRLSALIFPGMTITLAQVVTAGGDLRRRRPEGRAQVRRSPVCRHSAVSPSPSHLHRFEHRHGSLAANRRMERKVPGRRQRGWAGVISYPAGGGAARGL